MGTGIQQPSTQSAGNPFADVFKVLYEPGAVFERVRAQPRFLIPFATIIVIQCALFFVNLSYLKVAIAAQMATAAPGRPVPGTGVLIGFGVGFTIIIIGLLLLISGLVLYVGSSVVGGGEAKFGTLLSVAVYSAVPSTIVLTLIAVIVVHLQGTGQLTSPQDMQPALGLDLLASGAKGFVGGMLAGINPFTLWTLVLTAIGVATTQRMSKGTAYAVATASFVVVWLIASGLRALNG
jgi:hypothetical protein